jgi:hypothetical protein
LPKRRLKHRELLRLLKRFGITEDKKRGKGSERILIEDRGIDGKYKGPQYPIKCHGDDTEHSAKLIDAILRRFSIPEDQFWD